MTSLLVGLDGGGTKTDYLLSDLDGRVLKEMSHAPTSLSANGMGQAAFNLREGLRRLLEEQTEPEIEVLVIAVAGMDSVEERDKAARLFHEMITSCSVKKMVIINDAVAAWHNATEDAPSVVLVGGTGACCLGRAADGRVHKVSGLDFLLADEGSGYDAGRLALHAAVQSFDGRGVKTKLEQVVFDHFGVRTPAELKTKIYSPQITKDETASFARDCVRLAREGDAAARAIVGYCLDQLVLNVETVAKKLDFAEQEFSLVTAGTFLQNLLPEFSYKLQKVAPRAKLVTAEKPPVYGSLKIARQIFGGADAHQFEIY